MKLTIKVHDGLSGLSDTIKVMQMCRTPDGEVIGDFSKCIQVSRKEGDVALAVLPSPKLLRALADRIEVIPESVAAAE